MLDKDINFVPFLLFSLPFVFSVLFFFIYVLKTKKVKDDEGQRVIKKGFIFGIILVLIISFTMFERPFDWLNFLQRI